MTTLRVEVLEARDLKALDNNGKSDPYVRVALGSAGKRVEVLKTKTCYKTLQPAWASGGASIDLTLVDFDGVRSVFAVVPRKGNRAPVRVEAGFAVFTVWDEDMISRDDMCGQCAVSLMDAFTGLTGLTGLTGTMTRSVSSVAAWMLMLVLLARCLAAPTGGCWQRDCWPFLLEIVASLEKTVWVVGRERLRGSWNNVNTDFFLLQGKAFPNVQNFRIQRNTFHLLQERGDLSRCDICCWS